MNSVLDFHAIDFKKEVSNYGNSLNELEKAEARAVFTKCLNKGRSFEWIYFAIQCLYGRSITENTGLFFYSPFVKEVNEKCEIYDKMQLEYEEKRLKFAADVRRQQEERSNREVIKIKLQQTKRAKVKYSLDDI